MLAVFTWAVWVLAAAFRPLSAIATEQPSREAPRHIAIELVAESLMPAAGSRTALAIAMRPQDGWHGYWRSPGDAGRPLKLAWTLPEGMRVSDPAYPVPTTLVIEGMMNHVYSEPYALLVALDVPAGLRGGAKLPITVKLDYLVCSNTICVQESRRVSIELTVGDGEPNATSTASFEIWRRALPRPLKSRVHFETVGGQFRLGVPLPKSMAFRRPHLFAVTDGAISHAAPQIFSRNEDTLVIETEAGPTPPKTFDGVLSLGDGTGLSFIATVGAVRTTGLSGRRRRSR
jgi:DsbC/DsbD-like thiol-disulfide interchange protein